ncbi:alpha/beta hydrolase [Actinomadura kijaniata]|uniref:Pimeloyl-ACP methyl ester carboxylesterase n=1 Tax=Actinomadura namibiensis TaxID=182080 RepID=A0A7W3QNT5_ACTNM|nr:prolyl oligopeptidase family serine peptidase [Actinomadura namibiensis]MBA8953383.1 pimeloyl-ACP methyl ester carboxylesterase [Actinomadura namibiensis]
MTTVLPTLVPRLAFRGPSSPAAVALLLHGGREHSRQPASARQPAPLRMVPFALTLLRTGRRHRLAVGTLGYRYRGWNGEEASPVPDALWALDQVRHRWPEVPVVLVGHSMGARTALRVAGDAQVRGVAALAAWVPRGEPVDQLAGRRLLVMHGADDRTVPAKWSASYAERARAVAARVDHISVPGEGHAMLRHPGLWHRRVAQFTLDCLGTPTHP